MDLLHCLLPSPHLLHLDSYELLPGEHRLMLKLTSTQTQASCPICGQPSHRIHSRYTRTLADLPCVDFSLILIVQVCKFFCSNPDCRRRIFTERLPEVAAPWARKTARFIQQLQSIGLALGGAAGAHLCDLPLEGLCHRLGLSICGSTLLNQLAKLNLPDFKTPKTLGVDDFAFRKGHNYGTILVDLETHQPIALLADRKAETLTAWLKAHPGVEVLSRDRSKTYKSAMTEAAPDAIQVADRFHLVKNLSETLEQAFGNYRSELKAAEKSQHQDIAAEAPEETVLAVTKPTATEKAQQQILKNQQKKIEQQKTIKATGRYQDLNITLLGDDLYCHQPLCELLLAEQFNFILSCLPTSHRTLYEQIKGIELPTVVKKQWTGKTEKTYTYRYLNQVPLRDSKDALLVNWCELTITNSKGKVLYQNTFATNHLITDETVEAIVTAGRTRWKVENENNNTLKTKGYNLEHNFGHGHEQLAAFLATLNILALLFHTLLALDDAKYRLLRVHLSTRKTFFNDLRALTRYMCFDDWEHLLTFMIEGLELEVSADTS